MAVSYFLFVHHDKDLDKIARFPAKYRLLRFCFVGQSEKKKLKTLNTIEKKKKSDYRYHCISYYYQVLIINCDDDVFFVSLYGNIVNNAISLFMKLFAERIFCSNQS